MTDRIASEAEMARTLRDDLLPVDASASQLTYIGTMVADVRTIVTALGDDADLLDEIDPSDAYGNG